MARKKISPQINLSQATNMSGEEMGQIIKEHQERELEGKKQRNEELEEKAVFYDEGIVAVTGEAYNIIGINTRSAYHENPLHVPIGPGCYAHQTGESNRRRIECSIDTNGQSKLEKISFDGNVVLQSGDRVVVYIQAVDKIEGEITERSPWTRPGEKESPPTYLIPREVNQKEEALAIGIIRKGDWRDLEISPNYNGNLTPEDFMKRFQEDTPAG